MGISVIGRRLKLSRLQLDRKQFDIDIIVKENKGIVTKGWGGFLTPQYSVQRVVMCCQKMRCWSSEFKFNFVGTV